MLMNNRRQFWKRVIAPALLALLLSLLIPATALGDSLADYFTLSYNPVTFDKNAVRGNEAFHILVSGQATCQQDLPVTISEASLTSQVIAVHTTSGDVITLDQGYTITIKPFPSKAGETAEINQSLTLQFPVQATTGNYTITARVLEAKVKVLFVTQDVASYLPQEQQMGTIEYLAVDPDASEATQENPPPPPNEAETETSTMTASASTIDTNASPLPPQPTAIPLWIWPLAALSFFAIIFITIRVFRRR